jgi:hypothetical protein
VARLRDSWQRLLSHPRLGLGLGAAAVALSAPCLALGFFLDEYTARFIYSDLPGARQMYHSYSGGYGIATGDPADTLQQVEQGWAPWWVNPKLLTALMRPISEWTHWLDITLWPNSAFMMRAQSLLWLFSLVVIATRMYRRLLGPLLGGLAGLLLAFDHTHGYSVGYVANRHALVSATFALLCLDQHLRFRLENKPSAGVFAALCYAAALLSGESSLAIAAYLFAYALFAEQGPLLRRALSFAPYLVITIAWRVAYTLLGYGARGSGVYIDPAREPLHFLQALLERAPVLCLGQFFGPPAELYATLPPAQAHVMLLFAVLFSALLAAAFVPLLRNDRNARFWAVAFLLSLVPASTTIPNNRQLLLASVGAMGLLAQRWFFRASSQPDPKIMPARRGLAEQAFGVVFGTHLFLSPLALPFTTCIIALTAPVHRGIVGGSDAVAGHDVVFVTAPDVFTTKFVQLERRIDRKPLARRWRALSFGPQRVIVHRTDARTLTLEYPEGVTDTAFMELFRDRRVRMQPGERVQLEGLDIEVLQTTAGGRLRRVQFRFADPLDAPSFRFYAWRDAGFEPFHVPGVGEQTQLAAAPPQLGLKR